MRGASSSMAEDFGDDGGDEVDDASSCFLSLSLLSFLPPLGLVRVENRVPLLQAAESQGLAHAAGQDAVVGAVHWLKEKKKACFVLSIAFAFFVLLPPSSRPFA